MGDRILRVLPDEPAIDREFDYSLPADLAGAADVSVGSVVRVDLRGRRVRGWVTAVDVVPAAGVELAPVRKVSGHGPPPGIVDLAGWAARRWVGRRPHFLRTATADRVVAQLPGDREWRPVPSNADGLAEEAVARGHAVIRLPPAADDWPLVLAAARRGRALVLVPSVDRARHLTLRLDRAGVGVARYPGEWAAVTSAQVTVGARAAAWAPCGPLDAVLVLDEHDEAFQEESAPTWHARDVAVERARRDGAACLLVSPVPSLASLSLRWPLLRPSRAAERAGWPVLDVVDRRRDDPRMSSDWCSPALARLLERGGRVVAILNRKDRAAMVACRQCGTLAVGPDGRPLALRKDRLVGRATGEERPVVCAECGSTAFRRLRLGTEGVRDELERMARRPVVEITADSGEPGGPGDVADLVVGTEAALHRLERADAVAFLDFDQELLAPRYRAAEEAMSLLARAARLVGGRQGGGRIMVQTRLPRHPVLDAVLHADPGRLVEGEVAVREALRLPPAVAMAVVSGQAAAAYVERLGPPPDGVEVRGPAGGRWQVLAADHDLLSDTLGAVARPPGRLRIEVDPLRL